MITEPFKLSKWDILLIRYLKSNDPQTVGTLKTIWAARNAVEPTSIHLSYIVHRMAEIVQGCNPPRGLIDLIEAAAPSKKWQYGLGIQGDGYGEDGEHWERWAGVLASRLRLTEVKYLPGYREALDAQPEFEAARKELMA